MYCPKCKREIEDSFTFCPFCGVQANELSEPMKWYKFIIYFQLFVAALINLSNAMQFLTGLIQGDPETAKVVYSVFSKLKSVDIFFGVLYIGIAVFALYVRNRLAHFRSNGPKLYLWYLFLPLLLSVAYSAVTSAATGIAFSELISGSDLASTIIVNTIFIICNSIYFKKRQHLFVNN